MIPIGEAVRRLLFAVASAALLLATTLVFFLLPPVVHLLLGLSGSAAVLGTDAATAHRLSDSLVFDLLRAGDFSVQYGGQALLSAAERSHLVDVGALLRTVLGAGAAGALFLSGALLRLRVLEGGVRAGLRNRIWRSLADGAVLIALAAFLAGVALTLSFESTFSFFHSLVFAAGTWTFDPATDRLILLYPDAFWMLATLSFCATLVTLCAAALLVSRRASRRVRGVTASEHPASMAR